VFTKVFSTELLKETFLSRAGVPNLGDASPWGDLRGLKPVIIWLLLHQWGDAIGLRGDAETKRLGTPALGDKNKFYLTYSIVQFFFFEL
jgi:hypothetical protein